ncbi:hypothetical protein BsWGS_03919 [Bradybaena similaris]
MKLTLSLVAICLAMVCAFAQETTLSPEQVKRNEITAVINTLTPSCKTVVQSQPIGDDTLAAGCEKLEIFKALLGHVGCTTGEYDKLHAVFCYLNAAQETTLSPEQVKRNEFTAVINTLSSSCKTVVQSQPIGDETLAAGCKKLESSKALLGLVGCTAGDYNKLHAVLCYLNAAQETTLSPEQVKRNEFTAVINTLSSSCKTVVQSQPIGDETLAAGCKKLESSKALLGLVGCTAGDYNKLHAVLCYLNGVYVG